MQLSEFTSKVEAIIKDINPFTKEDIPRMVQCIVTDGINHLVANGEIFHGRVHSVDVEGLEVVVKYNMTVNVFDVEMCKTIRASMRTQEETTNILLATFEEVIIANAFKEHPITARPVGLFNHYLNNN